MFDSPSFSSLVFDEIADPDYTLVTVDILPAHAVADPAAWARSLFSPDALPRWLTWPSRSFAMLRRRSAAPFWERFTVRRVVGEEALIRWDARLVDLRVAVGVDERLSLVRVVTSMRFKGARSRILTLPARVALPFVLRGMITRAKRSLSGVTA